MSSTLFFAVGTIGQSKRAGRKPSTLLGAARHNQRAIQAERGGRSHIDADRSHLNDTIAGPDSPEAVVELAKHLMTAAGVDATNLRKDHTQAVELLFSLPPDTTIDTGEYFHRCLAWAGDRFGQPNILSACIHRDEAAPHCHILILPIVEGRMRGSRLITRPALAELRKSFSQEVARVYGLKEPPGRMSGAERSQAARLVLARLESSKDPILQSTLWQIVRRDIEHDPARHMAVLGLELPVDKPAPKKPQRTMAEIFTSKGRGARHEKPIGFDVRLKAKAKKPPSLARLKPIGFESEPEKHTQKHRNLSCVGFGKKRDVSTTTEPCKIHVPLTQPAAGDDQTDSMRRRLFAADDPERLSEQADGATISMTRERDGDHEAENWCEELGEFIQVLAHNSRGTRHAAHA